MLVRTRYVQFTFFMGMVYQVILFTTYRDEISLLRKQNKKQEKTYFLYNWNKIQKKARILKKGDHNIRADLSVERRHVNREVIGSNPALVKLPLFNPNNSWHLISGTCLFFSFLFIIPILCGWK